MKKTKGKPRKKPTIEEVYKEFNGYVHQLCINATYKYTYILRREHPIDTANELAEDCWVKLVKMHPKYDPSKSGIKTWVVKLSKQVISTLVVKQQSNKRRHIRVSMEEVERVDHTDDLLVSGLRQSTAKMTLETLANIIPRSDMLLMQLIYANDISRETLCEALAISQGKLCAIERVIHERLNKVLSQRNNA